MKKGRSVLIVCAFLMTLISFCTMTGKAAESSTYSHAVGASVVSSAIDMVVHEPEPRLKKELEDKTEAIEAEGYNVSFWMYDLNSGQGFSYRETKTYYSASTIKGPYIVCLAQEVPSCLDEQRSVIEETIHISSNDGYKVLWNTYGKEVFQKWMEKAGCSDIEFIDKWADITARELGLLWVQMYDYFMSDTEDSRWLASVFTDTLNSCIYDTLGDTYTVYSKAGWINSSEYYMVQNDAGIVMADEHPYVMVVLSNACERIDLLDPLIDTLDDIHTYMVND